MSQEQARKTSLIRMRSRDFFGAPTTDLLQRLRKEFTSAVPAIVLCLLSLAVSSQQQPAGGGKGNDAGSANDPSVPLTQLQFQNWFNPLYSGTPGEGNEFFFRPIVPFASKGLMPSSLVRLELDLLSLPNGRTGIGDSQFIDWFFPGYHEGSKIKIGIGPVIVAPSATNRYAGQGQWQVGPSSIVIYTGVPRVVLGVIEDNPITVTGERTRPGQNTSTLQPFVVKVLPRNYFLRFDPYWEFDWKEHGSATLPVNLGFGRTIKIRNQQVNTYIQPEYLARRPPHPGFNPPRFTLRLTFYLLYPKKE